MTARTGVKLPGWAKLTRPKKQPSSKNFKRQPLETREEEAYMRKRCYYILAGDMNDAMDCVLKEALAPSIDALQDYLNAAAPPSELRSLSAIHNNGSTSNILPEHASSSRNTHKRQRLFSSTPNPAPANEDNTTSTTTPNILLEGLDSELFDMQQDAQTPHDPLLLPIIILDGPPFGLDRKSMADSIVTSLRKSRTLSVVVQVEPKHQHHQSSTNWMMHELVKQCNAQVPVLSNDEALHRRITKRRKKKACTFSDMLLLWAQHITSFEDIVIVLEADDSFYSTELQDFLHILAARRSEQGIPVTVVLMGPHDGSRTMELRSTWQGHAGFMIRSLSLPTPTDIVDKFWQQLYLKRQFPILMPPAVLVAIQKSFTYHQSSFTKTLHKFQQALAYHLTQPGSLLTVANDPAVLSELWQRLAWFCVAVDSHPDGGEYCRELLVGAAADAADDDDDESEECSIPAKMILQIIRDEDTRQQQGQLTLQLMASISAAKKAGNTLSMFNPSSLYLLEDVTRRDMLEHLVKLRQSICNTETIALSDLIPSEPGHKALLVKYVSGMDLEEACSQENNFNLQQLTKKRDLVNELIVLVGNCRDGDSLSEIEQLLDEIVGRWLRHQSRNNTEKEEPKSSPWEWLVEKDWPALAKSFSPELRHQTVAAFLSGPSPTNHLTNNSERRLTHLSLENIAGTMYRLIQDRVAVAQVDWYEEFWQRAIVDDPSVEACRGKSFALFSMGLRFLKQSGFISEKLRVGSKSDIIYERAKLVWCGGD